MLRGNNQHRLRGLQNTRIAMVPIIVMVLFNHVKLLFLRRKFDGLFRCGNQPDGKDSVICFGYIKYQSIDFEARNKHFQLKFVINTVCVIEQ